MHEPLLSKLKDNLDHNIYVWIHNPLAGRHQKVVLNGTSSETSPVTSGVPKESILGPILFSFSYINDIVKTMESSLVLHAKDTVRSVPERTTAYYVQEDINFK